MGGNRGSFETTRWTQIQAAKTHDLEHRRESVNTLLTRYWKPVYCYLRRKGYNNADAKDLTQGFFHEIVLGRELLQRADQTKGRFRTFLLTALDRYATSVHRKDTAKKHVQTILSKLGVSDRTQAAVKAVRTGLVEPFSNKDLQ